MARKVFLSAAEQAEKTKIEDKVSVWLYQKLLKCPIFKKMDSDSKQDTIKNLFKDPSQDAIYAYQNLPKTRLSSIKDRIINILPFSKKGEEEVPILDQKKSKKDIIFHFFGMDEKWPVWRNLLGGVMVHSPEYPTYFIPSYVQSKNTGSAEDLKHGEGPRGLITGALEGIAVGALVSGKKLHIREMVPFIFLGMGLQLFSATVFPFLGEKMGKSIYEKNQKLEKTPSLPVLDSVKKENTKPEVNSAKVDYKKPYTPVSTGIKI